MISKTAVVAIHDGEFLNGIGRAMSSGGFDRIKYHTKIRRLLDTDVSVRAFLEGETSALSRFYTRKSRSKLGPLWDMLPEGATMHDHHACLKSYQEPTPSLVEVGPHSGSGSRVVKG